MDGKNAGDITKLHDAVPVLSLRELAAKELLKGNRAKAWTKPQDVAALGFATTADFVEALGQHLADLLGFPYALDDRSDRARTRLDSYADPSRGKEQLRIAVNTAMASIRAAVIADRVSNYLFRSEQPSLAKYSEKQKAAALTDMRSGGKLRNQACAQRTIDEAVTFLCGRAAAFLSRKFDGPDILDDENHGNPDLEGHKVAAAEALDAYHRVVLTASKARESAATIYPNPEEQLELWSRKALIQQLTDPKSLNASQERRIEGLMDVMTLYPFCLTEDTDRAHLATAEYLLAAQLPYTIIQNARKKLSPKSADVTWDSVTAALEDTLVQAKHMKESQRNYREIKPRPAALDAVRVLPNMTRDKLPVFLGLSTEAPDSALTLLEKALPLSQDPATLMSPEHWLTDSYNPAGNVLLITLNIQAINLSTRINFNLDHFIHVTGAEAKSVVLLSLLKKIIRAVGQRHGFPPPVRTQKSSFYKHQSVYKLNALLKGIITGSREADSGSGQTSNDVITVFTNYTNDLDAGALQTGAEMPDEWHDPSRGDALSAALDAIEGDPPAELVALHRRQSAIFACILTYPKVAETVTRLQNSAHDTSASYYEFSQPYLDALTGWEATDIRAAALETLQMIIWAETQESAAWRQSHEVFAAYSASRCDLGQAALQAHDERMIFDLVLQIIAIEAQHDEKLMDIIAKQLVTSGKEAGR